MTSQRSSQGNSPAPSSRGQSTRRAFVLGSSAAASAVFAACESGGGAPRPSADLRANLAVWGVALFPFDKDVGGDIVAGLRTKYPNISVEFIPQNDGLATKFTVAAAGGQPPDLLSTNGFMSQTLGFKGMTIALEDRMKGTRTVKKADMWPALVSESSWKGSLYALPYAPDLRVIYTAPDPYQRAGMDMTKPPKSWDEMLDAARRMTRSTDGTLELVGFDPFLGSASYNVWLVPFWQAGGELTTKEGTKVTLATEPAVKALTWIQQVIDAQGGWTRIKAARAGANLYQRFVDGKVAHLFDTFSVRSESFLQLDPKITFGYAPYPLPPGGRRANFGGVHVWVIAKDSKQQDASWLFMEELYDEANLFKFVDRYDRVPPTQSLAKSDKYLRNDPFRKLMIDEMPGRRWFIPLPGAVDMRQPILDLPPEVLEKGTSIQSALTNAQNAMQIVLDQALTSAQ